jgi:fumarate hydratase subunit alpha
MRSIAYNEIVKHVAELCAAAACDLPADVATSLKQAYEREASLRGRILLQYCCENIRIAQQKRVPICQDTGCAVYFVELGDEVHIEGGLLTEAINEGTRRGYRDGYLRKSIVAEPLFDRMNTKDNTPAIIHVEIVRGRSLRITLAPKGAGSENMSAVRMLKPSDGSAGVVTFAVDTVVNAGGNPCPPTIVGIGIGGTFEMAPLLAKKALLRELGAIHPDPRYAALEREILDRLNASGVGPQGLGGSVTALAVHIATFPCHIASLPVAVNINCHVARHASIEL